jgi:hypothetical protein
MRLGHRKKLKKNFFALGCRLGAKSLARAPKNSSLAVDSLNFR